MDQNIRNKRTKYRISASNAGFPPRIGTIRAIVVKLLVFHPLFNFLQALNLLVEFANMIDRPAPTTFRFTFVTEENQGNYSKNFSGKLPIEEAC